MSSSQLTTPPILSRHTASAAEPGSPLGEYKFYPPLTRPDINANNDIIASCPSPHIYDDLLFPSPPSPPRPRSTEQDAELEPLRVPGPAQSWIQVLTHEPLQRAADTTSLTLPLATVPPNHHNSLPRQLLHSASPSLAPGTIPLLIFPRAGLLYLSPSSPGESYP
jgi:hypothetical protein